MLRRSAAKQQAHNLRQPHTSSLHVHQVHQGPPRTTKAVWHGCVKVLLVHVSQSRSDGSRQAVRRRGATKGSQRQPREDDSHQISPSRWLAAPITGPNCIICLSDRKHLSPFRTSKLNFVKHLFSVYPKGILVPSWWVILEKKKACVSLSPLHFILSRFRQRLQRRRARVGRRRPHPLGVD